MKTRTACKHYDNCSAPLCPMLSDEENSKGLWYPDEEICCRRNDLPAWVKQQRKVVRKVSAQNRVYYFTLEMLMVPFKVGRAVRGIDSDIPDEERQIKSWLKRYTGTKKKLLPTSLREQKRQSVALARQARSKTNDERPERQISPPDEACHFVSENRLEHAQYHQKTEAK